MIYILVRYCLYWVNNTGQASWTRKIVISAPSILTTIYCDGEANLSSLAMETYAFPARTNEPLLKPFFKSRSLKGGNRSSIAVINRNISRRRSKKEAIINQNKLEIYCHSQQIRETSAVVVVVTVPVTQVRKSTRNGKCGNMARSHCSGI